MKCHIAKDLMPIYIDGLASEETAIDIAQHLSSCPQCEMFYEGLKTPLDLAPKTKNKGELKFLAKIKKRALMIKILAGVLGGLLIVVGVLAWIFAIGSPVRNEDVIVSQQIGGNQIFGFEKVGDFGMEYALNFNLINGRAIVPRAKAVMTTNAEGKRVVTGYLIKLYEVPKTSWLYESSKYAWGHIIDLSEPSIAEFTVTVRYKERDGVFGLKEEDLAVLRSYYLPDDF